MPIRKKLMAFDDSILDLHPELTKFLKPNDHYPELQRILKNRFANLPLGSFNTKVIIDDGKIVERVFETPQGKVISLYSKTSNMVSEHVA